MTEINNPPPNMLTEYMAWGRGVCDAPDVFHQYLGLATIGVLLGDKVWLPQGNMRIYPNQWVLLLAPSRLYRKSTSIKQGSLYLLKRIDPSIIMPNAFTKESLADAIIQQNTGLFFYDEFEAMIKFMKKNYAEDIKSFFTSLYDCELYDKSIFRKEQEKGKPLVMKSLPEHPVFSLFSSTTFVGLNDNLNDSDLKSGFFARFTVVSATAYERRWGNIPPIPVEVSRWMIDFFGKLWQCPKTVLALDQSAAKRYEAWCLDFEKKHEYELYSSNYGSMPMLCKKLSICCHVANNGGVITSIIKDKAMMDAIRLTNDLAKMFKETVEVHLERNKIKAMANNLWLTLKRIGATPRKKIYLHSPLNKRELDWAIEQLIDEGRLKIDDVKTATKTGHILTALDPPPNNSNNLEVVNNKDIITEASFQ